jgi:phosphoenolpyruvate carboxykinase (ATP)
MQRHKAAAWLVNTGWSGGPYGVGSRIKLAHTRAIIDAIHAGALHEAPTHREPVFGLTAPARCPGVPNEILLPEQTWPDHNAYRLAAHKLAGLFQENFSKFADQSSPEVRAAGPYDGLPRPSSV